MMLFHLEYFILSNNIYLFIAYARMCVYSHATAHLLLQVRQQPSRMASLIPLCVSLELNSNHQAWQQMPILMICLTSPGL